MILVGEADAGDHHIGIQVTHEIPQVDGLADGGIQSGYPETFPGIL